MRGWLPVLLATLVGCAYFSKERFDELYDQDNDGWGVDEDCNDENASIHPFAADVRGDGCDADCGEEADADGDDWPDDADCAPDDATVFPCAADAEGDDKDADCDGNDAPRTSACNEVGLDDSLGVDPDFLPAPGGIAPEQQSFPANCLPQE